MKFEPYEHKGKAYRKLTLASEAEIKKVQALYLIEDDRWLKKILAEKLLAVPSVRHSVIPRKSLEDIVACQIE